MSKQPARKAQRKNDAKKNSIYQFIGDSTGAQRSKFREDFINIRFLSNLMTHAAQKKFELHHMPVLVDNFGIDIVLKCNNVAKWLQLETKDSVGATSRWKIHYNVVNNPDSEVVLILVNYVANDELDLRYRLLDKTSVNSSSANTVTSGNFKKEVNISQLANDLFNI